MRALVLLFCSALASTALAQSERHERAAELAAQAHQRFEAGDAAGAEDLLEEALLQADDPALYFNLARTREQLEDWEGAASAYRAFMARRPDDERIPAIEERLRILEERIAEAQPEPEPAEPEPAAAPIEPVTERSGPAPWAWGLLGGGGAVLLGGVILGVVSRSQEEDAENATTGAEGAAALSDAQRSARLANVGFGLGGALALGGLIGLFLTRGAISVSPERGGARLDLHLRF